MNPSGATADQQHWRIDRADGCWQASPNYDEDATLEVDTPKDSTPPDAADKDEKKVDHAT
jgi:hypothetical protein